MIKYAIDYYNVEQPDGAGMYQEVLVSCATEDVAKKALEYYNQQGTWPRKVVKRQFTLNLIESVDEIDIVKKYKKIKGKKFEDLTDEELLVALKYRKIVN